MEVNFSKLLNLIGKEKHNDLKTILTLWISQKNLTSLKEIDLFIKQLISLVTKINNYENFDDIYNSAKYLSNNSGILELFIPICSNNLDFAYDFIEYYNNRNQKMINNCLIYVDKTKKDSLRKKLQYSVNHIGPFYLSEVESLMFYLDNNVPFNTIYYLYKEVDASYGLFDNLMEDISSGNIRRTLFKDFIFYKKIDPIDMSIIPDCIIRDLAKNHILTLIKLDINFQDIVDICRANFWDYQTIILPTLNNIAKRSLNGLKLKEYFEENFYQNNNYIKTLYYK